MSCGIKNFTFYLKSFLKITDHKWMDQIEFDLFDHKTTILIKKRLKLFFNEKLLRCGEFRFPKIIYCYRDPLNRMIVQYEKYVFKIYLLRLIGIGKHQLHH